ncbi:hypothetical protein C463_16636 [Halorubrum californiense DSM 19288]|uniref:Uncharacterized protein n=1 Tax=Halorubrum californiense DSM 19288 TaxID=1227465 RepID=M0DY44_9EURY|nr:MULTISPECIES: hypothetical protein [Halorubrum]ELZ39728.1 hypothetical protein C463_16636 [Halorubrum californiense DSM 19288]TKX65058.1 hypothetical protein EXE40_17240 [Halorubrum sp. GN11GM_10-3_MGM]
MTSDGESGEERDEEDLDAVQPPSSTTDPGQDPIDWEVQGEFASERDALDGPLNEVQPPSTMMNPGQDPIDPAQLRRGDAASDDDDESGAEGDGE